MNNILQTIVEHKRREVESRRSQIPDRTLETQLPGSPKVRDFRAALEASSEVAFIAEVKKASPSAGVIRADFDPILIAKTYARHGAACISVLTDTPYFQGHLSYLASIRPEVDTPLLRKDFV